MSADPGGAPVSSGDGGELRHRVVIRAEPSVVFAHLTRAEGLVRWMAVEARADPRPGGELTWTHENGATMVGRFVALDPPTRVEFRYGWRDDLLGVPPGSTTVIIELTATGDGATVVELTHRDLPGASAEDHRTGWAHFLDVLAGMAADLSPR